MTTPSWSLAGPASAESPLALSRCRPSDADTIPYWPSFLEPRGSERTPIGREGAEAARIQSRAGETDRSEEAQGAEGARAGATGLERAPLHEQAEGKHGRSNGFLPDHDIATTATRSIPAPTSANEPGCAAGHPQAPSSARDELRSGRRLPPPRCREAHRSTCCGSPGTCSLPPPGPRPGPAARAAVSPAPGRGHVAIAAHSRQGQLPAL